MNPNGITYALIIAVEKYIQSANFKKVAHARKDANDIKNALLNIGIYNDDIKLLIDNDATHTAINAELKHIAKRVTKDDRIIIFFAGHGTYFDETNWIIPVDAYKTNMRDTCVKIDTILGYLKKSGTKRNLIFIDSCHSGFEPGEDARDIDDSFMPDELVYHYSKEEYCCGFASSKSNQKSISNPTLKNGVWTHFLVKALKGEGGKIYQKGILFSDKLQSYLNKKVSEFVKMNTTDKKDQTPIMFGNLTDKFIIADLNEIFTNLEKDKVINDISFTNVTLLNNEEGNIKSLPGFQKGYHKVPTNSYSGADSFVKDIGFDLIKDEIDDLSSKIKIGFKYKRKEIEAYSEDGTGTIGTPDFTYSMEIRQSEDNPDEYILIRRLEGFSNSQKILDETFNTIFSNHFSELEFNMSNRIDVEELIDMIEELDEENGITVNYNPSDLSNCKILIEDLKYEILITDSTFSISNGFKTSPDKLISAYQETNRAILNNPELKMLSN